MSISESSVSSSEIEYLFGECSEEKSFDDELGGCYGFEPEYTEEEIKNISSDSSSSCEEDSSHIENLHWCSC